MRRLLLPMSLIFAFAGMCSGAPGSNLDEDKKKDNEDPIIVPVDGSDEEYWCCEYKDEDEVKQYALVEGPAECNTKYAKQDGRFVSGNQCIPCCCETAKDEEDLEKGYAHERTTPKSCNAAGGTCKSGDIKECGVEKKEPVKKPVQQPAQPVRPKVIHAPERRGDAPTRRTN